MNEDEAFIRAIVDHPGDDTHRLVYADWLDDRDDPRGAYLRAETEWVRLSRSDSTCRDPEELRELTRNLDQLWVHRVTRPPVGVCCEHVQLQGSRSGVEAAVLDAMEQRLKLLLPLELRALLLNHNGGKPKANEYRLSSSRSSIPDYVERFHSVWPASSSPEFGKGKPHDLEYATTALNNGFVSPATDDPAYQRWTSGVREFVAFASPADLGVLAIGLDGRRAGKVYAINRTVLCTSSAPKLVANSLAEFLAMLTAKPGKG